MGFFVLVQFGLRVWGLVQYCHDGVNMPGCMEGWSKKSEKNTHGTRGLSPPWGASREQVLGFRVQGSEFRV